MPANFPEIWLSRVLQNLNNSDIAPWLEGVPELDADVTQIHEGKASEQNKIFVAETDFEVDVLINNSTYPIPVQQYSDGTIEITLDKLQTKVTTLGDDEIIGAAYPKIDIVTKAHTRSLNITKYSKAIHAIAPAADSVNTPVLAIAGEDLTYEDLVTFRQRCDDAGFGSFDIRLVLCSKHWNSLLKDRKNFGDQLVNYAKGKPSPEICGFKLYKYEEMPSYASDGTKKAFGSASAEGDKVASVAFVATGIAKKTGLTKQYFSKATSDPDHQTNRLSYRHYFIVTPFQSRKIGAIIG